MLAQSWLPLLTASDFRLLALEHKTSSFAGGPARAAGPALYCPPGTPTAVAGTVSAAFNFGKFKFFSSQ